ncbi:hypothetical protein ACFVTC_41460 [Streptomyces sp. NPDC057950]|uniref:hypothetical protein n=1 Tax=Streptomyces sp. NPDC057950 TaxID=3346288 RepID=UPI0036E5E1C8
MDVLPDRTSETLAAWPTEHPGAEIICRDRATAYTKAVEEAAPLAAEGQVSGTRPFLEIQAHGYRGSRQVVRKHLAALRAGTTQPVRADIPSPRKIASWIMRPRETLTESQDERLLQVPLA